MEVKIKEVREKFSSKYSGSILDGTYDDRDVKWMKSNDTFITNCLDCPKTKGEVVKAVDLLDTVLTFRAKFKLNDLKESDLDSELVALDGLKVHGKDLEGRPIIIFSVKKMKKGYKVEEVKQLIAFTYNKHYMQNLAQKTITVMDCQDAAVSNMDLDLAKFVILCQSTYFPNISSMTLMYKMGPLLEGVWMIIKGFIDSDQKKNVHLVTRTNITQFINVDQLLPHMVKE